MKNYRTVAAGEIFSANYEIQKSKFISYVRNVEDEETAREFLLSVRKKHFDATHNCSARILGENAEIQKSNDDGEPGGTAGNPILETIKKNNLTNIIVVVTRYFGGIKLGAGGLIRAYSHAAALGINAAKIVEMKVLKKIAVTVEYNFLARVESFLRDKKIPVESTDYADVVTLNVLVVPEDEEIFLRELTDLTAANFLAEPGEEIFVPVEI